MGARTRRHTPAYPSVSAASSRPSRLSFTSARTPLLCLLALLLVLRLSARALAQPLEAAQLFPSLLLSPESDGGSGSATPAAAAAGGICRPSGRISDAACDFETVEASLNTPEFFSTLEQLVASRYFRYYKVDLFRDCPFWNENGLCMNRACGVDTVGEEDVPDELRVSRLSSLDTTDASEVFPPSTSSSDAGGACGCRESDYCHWEDEDTSREAAWVDLTQNPERFTGYAGASASRVWRSIYEENCFGAVGAGASLLTSSAEGFVSRKELRTRGLPNLMASLASPPDAGASEQCLEKRVFYRIVSGLHASISVHICAEYLQADGVTWAPNLQCFLTRIAQHPERLQNVYFNYVLLLRALARAGDYIDAFVLRPGDAIADASTRELLSSLVAQARASPPSFDERTMFHGADARELQDEFKTRFRNVSRIMDCVGCDKCRLWGKLQVNGLGTALKILFGRRAEEFDPKRNPELLQRSELVALINTVHRFAESLRAVGTFRELYQASLQESAEEKAAQKEAFGAPQSQRKSGSDGAAASSADASRRRDTSEAARSPSDSSGAPSSSSQARHAATSASPSAALLQRLRSSASEALRRTHLACQSSANRCMAWLQDALLRVRVRTEL